MATGHWRRRRRRAPVGTQAGVQFENVCRTGVPSAGVQMKIVDPEDWSKR
jgi:hypothetical protein